MSDDMRATQVPGPTGTPIPEKKSSAGRIVAIVAGLAVLGIVVGVAAAIIMFVLNSPTASTSQTTGSIVATGTVASKASTGTATGTGLPTGATAAAAPAGPAAEIANSEVFTFRDIFIPLLKAAPTGTGTGGGTTPTDTVTPTANGTLYLDNVVLENGVQKAVLRYNGKTYTLAAGESIPSSPWQVQSVSASSVTMLFGDVQVHLAVGQGITK